MRLTESDSGFLYGETASGPLQTASISIVDGAISFKKIYKYVEARLHLVPQFRQRLAWVPMNIAHPKWVDDPNFKLENHIIHHQLPKGTALLDAIDAAVDLNLGLMDRERPLWKYIVISGVKDRTLLLQQIHHAMIDGASAVHLSTVLYDFQPDAEPPPPPETAWQPAPLPTAYELVAEAMRENAAEFAQNNPLLNLQGGSESSGLLARGTEVMAKFSRPAITAPWNAGLLGPKRKMRWSTYPFGDFREIRNAFGGTVNDVILTTVSEGAARYLAMHDEQTADQYFRIMCPVSVRTEDQAGALGNRVSAMFPMLPAWPMDILERHQAVCQETMQIKDQQEAQALTLMQETGFSMPSVLFAPLQLVGTAFDPTAWAAQNPMPVPPSFGSRPPFFGMNFVCTNVPGVQVPQYLAGHEVLEPTAVMMMSGTMGYGLAITSYNQKMVISYTCEPRLLPDLEKMVEATESAFTELLEAARNSNSDAA
jgi:diacylglycerol O-acyltransferase